MTEADVTVILAAGEGSRLDGHGKALVRVGGWTLVERAAAAALDAGTSPLVVLGHRAEQVRAALRRETQRRPGLSLDLDPGLQLRTCPEWNRGLSASFRTGIEGARALGAARVAVVLVDQPGIGAAALRRVLDAHRAGRIARGEVDGRPTHPVVFEIDAAIEAAAAAQGDEGARAYVQAHPELLDAVDLTGWAQDADIDTVDDLQRWRAGQRGGSAG
ncbi:nucleotidyltransferase family protein [Nesterenkonia lutea]|uniref:Nicotine blue oxidoreductase n=1 Tax=Nesterenkonia lutea TaxID=272919 RepID=A0ABR9JFI0_9MICC|nr:NTP transferase domain-containing protein [Nesterenkonia lutea]MBE1524680.1 nicotine blue oxidoreductase [Nesterenkonia lutea]